MDFLIDTDDDDPNFIIGGRLFNRPPFDDNDPEPDVSFTSGLGNRTSGLIGGGPDNRLDFTTRGWQAGGPDNKVFFAGTPQSFTGGGVDYNTAGIIAGGPSDFIGGGTGKRIDTDEYGSDNR